MSIDTLESEREESLAAQNEASAIPKLTTWFSVSNGRLVGVAMLFGALVLTSGGALWAVDSGVSAPLALMVGYCAATSTVASFAATRTVRPMHVEQPATAPQGPGTSEAWKLVNTLTVSDGYGATSNPARRRRRRRWPGAARCSTQLNAANC